MSSSTMNAARYTTTCPRCGEQLKEGMPYEWFEGAAAHVDCDPDDEALVNPELKILGDTRIDTRQLQRPVCPGCFLELPVSGVCEECS